MQIINLGEGAFQSCRVELKAGETFISEAGAMAQMSAGIEYDVSIRKRGSGGLLSGLKRLFSGDSLFLSEYTATEPGHVVLAGPHVGNVIQLPVTPSTSWISTGGSFLGCTDGVDLDAQFQGFMKGMVSGESLYFLKLSGSGTAILNGFGHIEEITIDGDYVVDTGHVVAFDSSLQYKMSKAGSSWFQSFFAGEGFVFEFSGRGKVWVQSHNPKDFGRSIGPKLPPRN